MKIPAVIFTSEIQLPLRDHTETTDQEDKCLLLTRDYFMLQLLQQLERIYVSMAVRSLVCSILIYHRSQMQKESTATISLSRKSDRGPDHIGRKNISPILQLKE